MISKPYVIYISAQFFIIQFVLLFSLEIKMPYSKHYISECLDNKNKTRSLVKMFSVIFHKESEVRFMKPL